LLVVEAVVQVLQDRLGIALLVAVVPSYLPSLPRSGRCHRQLISLLLGLLLHQAIVAGTLFGKIPSLLVIAILLR